MPRNVRGLAADAYGRATWRDTFGAPKSPMVRRKSLSPIWSVPFDLRRSLPSGSSKQVAAEEQRHPTTDRSGSPARYDRVGERGLERASKLEVLKWSIQLQTEEYSRSGTFSRRLQPVLMLSKRARTHGSAARGSISENMLPVLRKRLAS